MNPIFKKLNFKNQRNLHILNAPGSFHKAIDEMAPLATIKTSLGEAKNLEFFLGFVTKQKEVDELTKKIDTAAADDAVVWFAYPKGSSKKYTCEFNRDNGWNELGKAGYEPVRMVAIDEDWSALRFRRAENIKKMTRSSAISAEGKKRLASAKKIKTARIK